MEPISLQKARDGVFEQMCRMRLAKMIEPQKTFDAEALKMIEILHNALTQVKKAEENDLGKCYFLLGAEKEAITSIKKSISEILQLCGETYRDALKDIGDASRNFAVKWNEAIADYQCVEPMKPITQQASFSQPPTLNEISDDLLRKNWWQICPGSLCPGKKNTPHKCNLVKICKHFSSVNGCSRPDCTFLHVKATCGAFMMGECGSEEYQHHNAFAHHDLFDILNFTMGIRKWSWALEKAHARFPFTPLKDLRNWQK